MIGGIDIVLQIGALDEAAALDGVVRAATSIWPHAVFEDGDTGRVFASIAAVELAGTQELFIYRTDADRAAWDRDGCTPDTDAAMLHAIARNGELTLVVSDPVHADGRAVVDEVSQWLSHGWARAA